MNIKTSRLGVPYVDDDGEIIPVTALFASDLAALEHAQPGSIDAIMRSIKLGIETIAGIDSDLDDGDWFVEFNNLMSINEFLPALNAVGQARQSFAYIKESENV